MAKEIKVISIFINIFLLLKSLQYFWKNSHSLKKVAAIKTITEVSWGRRVVGGWRRGVMVLGGK